MNKSFLLIGSFFLLIFFFNLTLINSRPSIATITKITDPEIGLKIINITVKNPAQTVKIIVTKLEGKPAKVVHEIAGKVYKYIEINAENINETNIDKVKIQFEVNKSWINSNNIDPDTVALNRYKNGWNKLPTTKTGEDNDFVYYEAETPGFSTFAITGEVRAETTTTTRVTIEPTVTIIPPRLTTVAAVPLEIELSTIQIAGAIIGIVVILVLVVFLFIHFQAVKMAT